MYSLQRPVGECKALGDAEKELASRVSWNEAALCYWYFHSLLLHLHTEVLCSGKPTTLVMLCFKAQDADNIYWMQEEEHV